MPSFVKSHAVLRCVSDESFNGLFVLRSNVEKLRAIRVRDFADPQSGNVERLASCLFSNAPLLYILTTAAVSQLIPNRGIWSDWHFVFSPTIHPYCTSLRHLLFRNSSKNYCYKILVVSQPPIATLPSRVSRNGCLAVAILFCGKPSAHVGGVHPGYQARAITGRGKGHRL